MRTYFMCNCMRDMYTVKFQAGGMAEFLHLLHIQMVKLMPPSQMTAMEFPW